MVQRGPTPDCAPVRPYRDSEATPLEALVHRGPQPIELRRPGMDWAGVGGVLGMWFAFVVSPVLFFVVAFVYVNRRMKDRHAVVVAEMQAYARASEVDVRAVDVWCASAGGPGAVHLIMPIMPEVSALAEAAVRVTVPEARVTRVPGGLMVRWTLDFPIRSARLMHLIDTLAPHCEELGLVRVTCVRPPAVVVASGAVEL